MGLAMATVSYSDVGVKASQEMPGFKALLDSLKPTFDFPSTGKPALDFGYFANVLDIGNGQGLAISNDGVGTKIIVAQLMGRYDTVGIDCVAMNANDVICVGARPIAMTDYVAVQDPHEDLLTELGKGLAVGAERAGISIPAGEIAQIPDMIQGETSGYGFDLVGGCVGLVDMKRIVQGKNIQPGECLVGLASSGIHSNGLTLAREALLGLGDYKLDSTVAELGRTVGDELLEPTAIYVKAVLRMLEAGLEIKALVHITSDGFMNLTRVQSPIGFRLDSLPAPQPIFELIRRSGDIPAEEMFRVFNMGVGFVVVVSQKDAQRVIDCAQEANISASVIGECTGEHPEEVHIPSHKLVGREGRFARA